MAQQIIFVDSFVLIINIIINFAKQRERIFEKIVEIDVIKM